MTFTSKVFVHLDTKNKNTLHQSNMKTEKPMVSSWLQLLSQLETYIALGVVTKDDVNPPVISGSFPALQLSASIPSRFYNPPISTNHPPRAMKLSNHPAHPQPSIKPSHSTAIPSKGPQWHNPSPNFQRPSPGSPAFRHVVKLSIGLGPLIHPGVEHGTLEEPEILIYFLL